MSVGSNRQRDTHTHTHWGNMTILQPDLASSTTHKNWASLHRLSKSRFCCWFQLIRFYSPGTVKEAVWRKKKKKLSKYEHFTHTHMWRFRNKHFRADKTCQKLWSAVRYRFRSLIHKTSTTAAAASPAVRSQTAHSVSQLALKLY